MEDLCNFIEGLLDMIVDMREFVWFIMQHPKDLHSEVSNAD